jgi:mRNA-degrading endonuclease toxin of MazEF toxin-antitoxin module
MIRQGEVYWLDDCPHLDDTGVKRRPVIVLSPKAQIQASLADVLCVACSTTISEAETDRIRLPSKADTPLPFCRTGLTKPCWAVPRWALPVAQYRLKHPVGHIKNPLLDRIIKAVEARLNG